MKKPVDELSKVVTIVNELGLHARSAAKISALAKKASASIWLTREGEDADATSIIDVLSLACPKGSEIRITIENPVDLETLKALVNLIESGFGE
jgi:phosphocarrier protein HPr